MTPFEELLKKSEGELTSRRAAELDAELKTSPELEREQRRVDQLIAAATKPDPALENVDLREGLWTREVPKPEPRRSRAWPLAAIAAVAAAVFFFAPAATDEFRAKSGHGTLTGLEVFVVRNGTAEPLGASIHRGDALGFAYRNQPDSSSRALAIAATDSTGRVFWFYPEWREGQPPPRSMTIATSTGRIELPDAVKHEFATGRLTINAFFTAAPVSVLELESGGAKPSETITLEVLP
ncbi:MAG: hypothetical protein QM817_04965 [Archangium sp.]